MSNLTVKKGDTFSVLCQRTNESGTPLSISGLTITSSVRSTGGFSAALSTAVVNASLGQFTIGATSGQTSTWPVYQSMDGTVAKGNILYCDVQYSSAGVIESTETFQILVEEDIT